jgi:hypothetical protein
MRFPPSPPEFTRRHTLVGKFVGAGGETGYFDCLVDVSLTGSHHIIGYVLGNHTSESNLQRVHRPGRPLRLEAVKEGATWHGSDVFFHQFMKFGPKDEECPEGLMGVVGHFRCSEFTERVPHDPSERPRPRRVSFFLHGPRQVWPTYYGPGKQKGTKLHLGTVPFTVQCRGHHIDARRDSDVNPYLGGDRYRASTAYLRTTIQSLDFATSKGHAEYSDEAFLADAQEATEDLCFIVGMLSHGVVNWYSHFQAGKAFTSEYTRSVQPRPSGYTNDHDELIWRADVPRFLGIAFRRLRQLRTRGIDLRIPIGYAITGAETAITAQKFGLFYLGLEAAKAQYAKVAKVKAPVHPTYNACKREALKAINAYAAQSRQSVPIDWWKNKIGDRRPTLWQAVEPMLRRFRVGWTDMYPSPGKEPTFTRVRNKVFHSGTASEGREMLNETRRLQGVLQRLMLRWLGWQDLLHAPGGALLHFTNGGREPSGEELALLRAPAKRRKASPNGGKERDAAR